MDKTTIERLEGLGGSKNAWKKVSSSTESILKLQTTERNTPGTEGVRYWQNGVPTTNLPELEIAGKKVKVFYQKPTDGYGVKVGISVDRGTSVIELSDLFGTGEWSLSADGSPVLPDTGTLDDISDLLNTYHCNVLRSFGNNYIDAATVT